MFVVPVEFKVHFHDRANKGLRHSHEH